MNLVGMNLVAIETATETVAVAVRTTDGLAAELALTGRRRHVETLTPALEHLLAQVGLPASQISAVAVDLGPGLFTGLRVGIAAAKGLAQSLGIGVVGLSSLEILAAAAAGTGLRGHVLSRRRRPAGRGLRLAGRGRPGGPVAEAGPPQLLTPEALVALLGVWAAPGGDGHRGRGAALRRGLGAVPGRHRGAPRPVLAASDHPAGPGRRPSLQVPRQLRPLGRSPLHARRRCPSNFAQVTRA